MKNKLSKLFLIDIGTTIVLVIVWFIYSSFRKFFSLEDLVDLIFLIFLILTLVRKDSHPRLFWYGFFFLILSAVASLFQAFSLASTFSSLVIGFFFLGVVNQLLFSRK